MEDLAGSADCTAFGGEMFPAVLTDWRAIDGSKSGRVMRSGFFGHAVPRSYRRELYLILQPAPSNVRNELDVEYLARNLEVIATRDDHVDPCFCGFLEFRSIRSYRVENEVIEESVEQVCSSGLEIVESISAEQTLKRANVRELPRVRSGTKNPSTSRCARMYPAHRFAYTMPVRAFTMRPRSGKK